MKRNIMMLITLIALTLDVNATNVSGVIFSNTTWTVANSPYVVTGNILVNTGVTLTIEAGVTVMFDSLKSMQVDGCLIAQGTGSNNIIFTSNIGNHAGAWGYLYFSNSSTDASYENHIFGNYQSGSILEYCIIQYAGGVSVADNGALRLDAAYPFINQCIIRNNLCVGINSYDYLGISSGNMKITNSQISENESTGIYVYAADSVLISGNHISHNNNPGGAGGGIFVSDANYTKINENYITDNIAYGGGGISVGAGSSLPKIIILNNILINNSVTGGGGSAINTGLGTMLLKGNIALKNNNQGGGSIAVNGQPSDVSNNIVADNFSDGIGGGFYMQASAVTFTKNQIIRNTALDIAGLYEGSSMTGVRQNNTIALNTNTETTPTAKTIYCWNNSLPHLLENNIFGNTGAYELSNGDAQGTANLTAINNWWGTTNLGDIQGKIYDWFDNNTLALVDFNPVLTTPDTLAPVSPPVDVTKTNLGGGSIKITWSHNPESDIAGYHLYYGSFNGYAFTNMVDVGNDTIYVLSGVSITDTIGVTAYDNIFSNSNENLLTIVNDNMIYGNESWYSYATVECSTLALNMSAIDASCSTCNDGTATANVSSGLAPYDYAWNTSPVQTNYTATALLPETYVVTVTDFNGCVLTDSVVVSFSTSVDEKTNANALTIYPVPASDMVTINVNSQNKTDVTLNIYNTIGTLVKSEILKQNNQQINVEDLSNGIYVVEIKSKDWTEKQKLIIQR